MATVIWDVDPSDWADPGPLRSRQRDRQRPQRLNRRHARRRGLPQRDPRGVARDPGPLPTPRLHSSRSPSCSATSSSIRSRRTRSCHPPRIIRRVPKANPKSPLELAPRERLPSKVDPMLAKMGKVPVGDEWAFEIKWDGVRALGYAEKGKWRMSNRRGEEITARYPELEAIAEQLGKRSAILDGEVCAFTDGRPSFQRIQRRMTLTSAARSRRACATARDLGDLRPPPPRREERARPPLHRTAGAARGPRARRGRWHTPRSAAPAARISSTQRGTGPGGHRRQTPRQPLPPGRRTGEWIKTRIWKRQEFVIGGYIPGEGSRSGGPDRCWSATTTSGPGARKGSDPSAPLPAESVPG